jgi:competence protein ComEA
MHKFKLTTLLLTLIASLSLASGVFAEDSQMSSSTDQKAAHHRASHERATKEADPQGKIDINSADAKSLTLLKGIGEKRAEAIVKYREANGNFKSIDELSKVKGISKSIIDKNRDHMTV